MQQIETTIYSRSVMYMWQSESTLHLQHGLAHVKTATTANRMQITMETETSRHGFVLLLNKHEVFALINNKTLAYSCLVTIYEAGPTR